MIIELSINQSVLIHFVRQIRVRADLQKRQTPTYQKSQNNHYLGDMPVFRHDRMLLNIERTGSALPFEQLKP